LVKGPQETPKPTTPPPTKAGETPRPTEEEEFKCFKEHCLFPQFTCMSKIEDQFEGGPQLFKCLVEEAAKEDTDDCSKCIQSHMATGLVCPFECKDGGDDKNCPCDANDRFTPCISKEGADRQVCLKEGFAYCCEDKPRDKGCELFRVTSEMCLDHGMKAKCFDIIRQRKCQESGCVWGNKKCIPKSETPAPVAFNCQNARKRSCLKIEQCDWDKSQKKCVIKGVPSPTPAGGCTVFKKRATCGRVNTCKWDKNDKKCMEKGDAVDCTKFETDSECKRSPECFWHRRSKKCSPRDGGKVTPKPVVAGTKFENFEAYVIFVLASESAEECITRGGEWKDSNCENRDLKNLRCQNIGKAVWPRIPGCYVNLRERCVQQEKDGGPFN